MQSIIDSLNFREFGPFNSREIATAICITSALILCLRSATVRDSFQAVIKAFFAKKLVALYLITLAYSIIPLAVFYHLGFWRNSLIKDALFWLLFSAIPTLMTLRDTNRVNYFKNALYSNLKFSLIIEFIVGMHTFHVLIEIIIVLVSVLFAGIIVMSAKDPKLKAVNTVFTLIAQAIGVIIFLTAVYSFVNDFKNSATLEKFEEFSLPIILGIWIVPLLFMIHVYMTYENIYVSMGAAISDKELYRFAKIKSLLHFKFNTSSLKRWSQSLFNTEIRKKQDILISFLDLERLELIESSPPEVASSQGWSPYEAKKYLENDGIRTSHYKRIYNNEWQAISAYIKLGDEIIDNDIAYYVLGDQSIAKCLEVVVNVNFVGAESLALEKFMTCAKTLTVCALNEPMPMDMANAIQKQESFTRFFKNRTLSLSKFNHLNRINSYTLKYSIEQPSNNLEIKT